MDYESKSFGCTLDGVDASSERGVFSGYASVFGNVDHDGDVIDRGAFANGISAKSVKMLRQHKHSDLIGVWREIKPDDHGLRVVGELNLDVQLARETYSLLRQGALDQMSVGFKVPRGSTYDKEVGEGPARRRVRHIKQAQLFEISLVSIAANPLATITDVKAAGRMWTVREFEALLKGADWTRAERAEIAGEYKALMKRARLLPSDSALEDEREAAELASYFRAAIGKVTQDLRRTLGG